MTLKGDQCLSKIPLLHLETRKKGMRDLKSLYYKESYSNLQHDAAANLAEELFVWISKFKLWTDWQIISRKVWQNPTAA